MCDLPCLFTLAEVSNKTGFALRSLELDCRAGRVEHVHRGRDRFMTAAQVELLIAGHTKRPTPTEMDARQAAGLERLNRRMARRRNADKAG